MVWNVVLTLKLIAMKRFLVLPVVLTVFAVPAQFSVPRVIHEDPVSRQRSTTPADMDGDGDIDLVGVSHFDGRVAWWENDGSGGFLVKHAICAIGTFQAQLVTGDPDGDGDIDVMVTGGSLVGLAWLEQLGNGQFAPLQELSSEMTWFDLMRSVDLNNDGRSDLLCLRFDGNDLGVVWYECSIAREWTLHGPVDVGGIDVDHVEAADVDADGRMDLLVSSGGLPSLSRLSGTGSGEFLPPETAWSSDLHIWNWALADFDADGDPDLVANLQPIIPRLTLSLNDGGTFSEPVVFDTTALFYPALLRVADLDDDGDPDLLGGEDRNTFWCRNDAGILSPRIPISGITPDDIQCAPLDEDQRSDLVITGLENVRCHFQFSQAGQFGPVHLVGPGFNQAQHQLLADFDGVPGTDLLVTSRMDAHIGLFPRAPGNSFLDPIILDPTATAAAMSVALDDDGDGDNDILSVVAMDSVVLRYENNGDGSFQPRATVRNGLPWADLLKAADLDADGHPDLVTGGISLGDLLVLFGNGDGTYSAPVFLSDSSSATDFEIVDLDMDGDLDIVSAEGPLTDRIIWHSNDGQGGFGPVRVLSDVPYYPHFIALGDLDGDGHADLLATDAEEHLARMMAITDTTFAAPVPIEQQLDHPYRGELADFDMDGDLDVIAAYEYGGIRWYRNDGSGAFDQPHELVPLDQVQTLAGINDVDADGDTDVMICSWDHGTFGYLENMIIGGFTIQGEVFADLDEDGVRDPEEPAVQQAHINCDPPATAPLTNPDGSYTFYLPEGDYAVSVQNVPEYWALTTSPAQYDLALSGSAPAVTDVDFGLTPTIDTTIIALNVTPGQVPCGDTTIHQLSVINLGTTRPSLVIAYALDTLYQFLGSVPPVDSLIGHVAYWHLDELTWQLPSTIVCELISPLWAEVQVDSTSGNTLSASVQGAADVCSAFFSWTMECAYDPNDKRVDPTGYGVHGAIPMDTEELVYTIRFQNTGTATAQDVIIRDQFSQHLDASSLQLLGWSHAPTGMGIENDGEFFARFDGIQLPDSAADQLGSMGHLTFRVRTRPGLEHGTVILNDAEIYFDNEPGIVTNTTVNTLIDCDLWVPTITEPIPGLLQATPGDRYQWFLNGAPLAGEQSQQLSTLDPGIYSAMVTSQYGCAAVTVDFVMINTGFHSTSGPAIAIFPVPFSNTARLVMNSPLTEDHRVELVDATGRVCRSWPGQGRNEMLLDRTGAASGLYLVRVLQGAMQVAVRTVVVD